jgi:putative transcriptional regulator
MTKRKRDIGAELIEAAEEALAFTKGKPSGVRVVNVPEEVDVRAVRQRLGLTQEEFAARYGFGVSALRDWEQRRRRPEKAARILLKVIQHEPRAVERALAR